MRKWPRTIAPNQVKRNGRKSVTTYYDLGCSVVARQVKGREATRILNRRSGEKLCVFMCRAPLG